MVYIAWGEMRENWRENMNMASTYNRPSLLFLIRLEIGIDKIVLSHKIYVPPPQLHTISLHDLLVGDK